MIINEKEYKKIKDISNLTLTDYKVIYVIEDKYWLPEDSIMAIIDDLKYEYEHVVEELEDAKNNYNDQIDLDYYYDMQKEREMMKNV